METVKLIVAYFANPFGLSLLLIGFAWLATYKQRQQLANRLWAIVTLLLSVGGLSAVTYETRRAREYQYDPLRIAAEDPLLDSPSTIVVLGAGFNADDYLPANSRVSSAYLARLIEGVRIHRQLPNSRLVVSVAGKADTDAKRAFIDEMIEILAIQANRVQIIDDAESTDDEASAIQALQVNTPVILVTSAGHMPRAKRIFDTAGLSVVAAPADYGFTRAASPNDKPWQRWIPSLDGLGSNGGYTYEAVATLASKIKRMINARPLPVDKDPQPAIADPP